MHLQICICAISFEIQTRLLQGWFGTCDFKQHKRERSEVNTISTQLKFKTMLTWRRAHHENTECDFAYEQYSQVVLFLQTPPIL